MSTTAQTPSMGCAYKLSYAEPTRHHANVCEMWRSFSSVLSAHSPAEDHGSTQTRLMSVMPRFSRAARKRGSALTAFSTSPNSSAAIIGAALGNVSTLSTPVSMDTTNRDTPRAPTVYALQSALRAGSVFVPDAAHARTADLGGSSSSIDSKRRILLLSSRSENAARTWRATAATSPGVSGASGCDGSSVKDAAGGFCSSLSFGLSEVSSCESMSLSSSVTAVPSARGTASSAASVGAIVNGFGSRW
mmetsp:Transcript_6670/g.27977  ORF Transcript_6670/g.27977 Transcript_6670/m.27977 type:complete len:247 (-) Transcript_6670:22-762(-)